MGGSFIPLLILLISQYTSEFAEWLTHAFNGMKKVQERETELLLLLLLASLHPIQTVPRLISTGEKCEIRATHSKMAKDEMERDRDDRTTTTISVQFKEETKKAKLARLEKDQCQLQ